MRRKFSSALAVIVVLAFSLAVSGCKAPALSGEFSESDVYDRAVEVITLLHAGDYAAVNALTREDVQSALTADTLKTVCETYILPKGAFKDVTASSIYGTSSADKSEDFAVAALACAYENGKITYTLSFDKDLALVGLYLK